MENSRNLLKRKEAEEVIQPYYGKIVNAINDGFQDYLKVVKRHYAEGDKVEFRKTTIAGMVHDFTTTRIKYLFADDSNVEAKEYNKIFGVKICDKLLIRFKKINDDFTTSNIQTQQTIQWANQLEIDGLPEKLTLLYAGYMPDVTWTSIKNIYLLCKQGENLIWQIDLTGSIEQTELKFNTITEEQEEIVERRVKTKTKEQKDKKTAS